ncbi:type VI secretion system protein TssA [Rhodoferax saidenbachensis]|uniref:Type VI secretion system protein ImpA n=1 Tax=Rhodoferax saidenbachensis TaxID=1484693 RepID=A0ABU1ZRE6_9BURK|nr:type VI secretion system protein TssA [Rhodoferax saidenbachensis]MDR7307126.1 type VI secretion system protein ImpA [Rhodoferax saidenbachensis]
MDDSDEFQPDVEGLLVPVAGELPAGPSMRYDPQYMAIRIAREEEDPRLPMREWERPLKKADWRAVADNACAILRSRSKDFQVAAWLCEAWIQQHQLKGFHAAVRLITGLVDGYWDTAHPQIEAEDDEARIAPLYWMNENLPRVLMLRVPLMHLPERMPSAVNVFDWDQALALENRKPEGKKPTSAKNAAVVDSPIPTRSEIVAGASGTQLQLLIDNRGLLLASVAAWEAFTQALNEKMGMQAPSVAKVPDVLQRMLRMCDTLIAGREPLPKTPTVVTPAPAPTAPFVPVRATESLATVAPAAPLSASTPLPESDNAMGPINSREDAYRMLDAVAEYLQKTEPHSPTPYLVKRAVTWGRMSLGDLMQEIVREEGDIGRYFSLLGIKGPKG